MRLSSGQVALATVLLGAVAFPAAAVGLDQAFYVSLASRIMIYALAASSLNLLLGYGGMVSFGHAAYVGAGAYTVAILAYHTGAKTLVLGLFPGTVSAWVAWPLAMIVSGALAWLVGAVSLRTRGVYFIMITLAFAQMLYYFFVSIKAYGGDDGLNLARRSSVGLGIDLASDVSFYYVVLFWLTAVLFMLHRAVNARFGRVIAGIRENDVRMETIGYPVYRYKLGCFIIGGSLAGLAGALLVNQNNFISPNTLHWTQSGTLLVMLIAGGVGSLYGGVIGAAILLLLEEVLSAYTSHWQLGIGIVLLGVVFFAPQGVAGMLSRRAIDTHC